MRITALIGALLLCVSSAGAQRVGGRRAMRPPNRPEVTPRRQALEKQFREHAEQVVRDKLHLSDDQVSRLRSVNANVGAQRNSLLQQERSVRADLLDEMAKGNGADQTKVSQLMAQAHDIQSKRFALQQDEQRQLSTFMTPVQVAQYVGFQAQVRAYIRQKRQADDGNPEPPNP